VLYFDGSLVPPSFKSSRKPIATCTAAITSDEGQILALGVKRIQESFTSADVEYEGLILGMKWLVDRIFSGEFISASDSTIRIRGDCKTVIDQMNLKSFPRKQRQYYNEASDLIKYLRDYYEIYFEHVLRENNVLCDASCSVLQNVLLLQQIEKYRLDIQRLESSYVIHPLTKLSKKKLLKTKESVISPILHRLQDIPFMFQPYYLCQLCALTLAKNDFIGLRVIGETILEQIKVWKMWNDSWKGEIPQKIEFLGYLSIHSSLTGLNLNNEAAQYFDGMSRKYDMKHETYNLSDEIAKVQNLVPSTIDMSNQMFDYNSSILNNLHTTILNRDHTNIQDVWWMIENEKIVKFE
jgi:ribonuclease HI